MLHRFLKSLLLAFMLTKYEPLSWPFVTHSPRCLVSASTCMGAHTYSDTWQALVTSTRPHSAILGSLSEYRTSTFFYISSIRRKVVFCSFNFLIFVFIFSLNCRTPITKKKKKHAIWRAYYKKTNTNTN